MSVGGLAAGFRSRESWDTIGHSGGESPRRLQSACPQSGEFFKFSGGPGDDAGRVSEDRGDSGLEGQFSLFGSDLGFPETCQSGECFPPNVLFLKAPVLGQRHPNAKVFEWLVRG